MSEKRDPFPFPRYENDRTFTGIMGFQKRDFSTPTHLAQIQEPWSRLSDRATVASMKRHVLHCDQHPPKDSLDFHLSSTYDHHQEFLREKNHILYQKETFLDGDQGNDTNQSGTGTPQARAQVHKEKRSIHSIQGAIESHHNASTNRGYSRKHDGGFYST
ncbi:cilia- and flagella-associated protein 276 [Denticeps clupeoides]|uniref:Uncharacterized protein n=1 Tax=Denticeps clupeoides TaxID=299321 RepID=A0AAY4BWI4_9TELE|nr:uncharacterized protein C1orf194 homolog [Denticeps clupeoides]XP_028849430.1 uncharacterized protein C1orf194 homolog [Denticeps clupeoides]